MPYSELHPGQLDELVTPAALEVESFCLHGVRSGLYEIYDRLDSLQPDDYDGTAVGRVISGMAGHAAEAGDVQRVEADIDILRRLPDVPKSIFAATCFAGVAAGSQRAFDILRGALEAEKFNAQRQNAARARRTGYARANSSAGMLKGLIYVCAERDVPPDVWIEEYSVGSERKWQLYMQYYDLMDERSGHDDDTYQQRLEQKVSELIEPGEYSEDFVYDQAGYALQFTKNPGLKERVIKRFRQASSEVALTAKTFKDLIWLGLDVIRDPELANKENVKFFEQAIDRDALSLHLRSVMDPFELVKEQLVWRTGLKVHYGATGRDVRDSINLLKSQMLTEDIPDKPSGRMGIRRSKEDVEQLCDSLLMAYAGNYSDAGDFASARLFIYDMVNEPAQQRALKNCLERARSFEELEAIRPDEITLALRPGLHSQFKFAEAFLANDMDRLRVFALGYARTIGEGNSHLKHDYIRDVHETYAAVDEPEAAAFAKELLTILREAGEHYSYVSYLSDALIRAGDPLEPGLAYRDINRCFKNSSERLYEMWRLAGLLRGQPEFT